ncbi:unnamed protein product [Allacma fusca]|uniref:Uncharacterized protein n=1 Tax=Allacma fusca TaxID=39272 RepID=A0A8J2J964_9HEXA|nr:unnamed protein product [Allacma fusca]
MAGVRYEQDDPRLWAIFNKKQELVDKSGRNVALYLIPYLAKSFPSLSGWNDILRLVKEMRSVTSGHVKYHEKTLPADGASRDFIDAYLYEIRATTDPNSSFFKENGIRSLLAVMGDLFNAGFETVTLTLSWALLYLVRFPEVQKKLQKELDTVVGRNRHPALADRPSLPYELG